MFFGCLVILRPSNNEKLLIPAAHVYCTSLTSWYRTQQWGGVRSVVDTPNLKSFIAIYWDQTNLLRSNTTYATMWDIWIENTDIKASRSVYAHKKLSRYGGGVNFQWVRINKIPAVKLWHWLSKRHGFAREYRRSPVGLMIVECWSVFRTLELVGKLRQQKPCLLLCEAPSFHSVAMLFVLVYASRLMFSKSYEKKLQKKVAHIVGIWAYISNI